MKFCQKLVCLFLFTLFFISLLMTIYTSRPEYPLSVDVQLSEDDLLLNMPATLLQVLAEQEVEGWGYNFSRDANLFANTTPLILPNNFCYEQTVMVIMVHSAPSRKEARHSIRKSWGKVDNTVENNVTLYFLLAATSNSILQTEIVAESEKFGDIIQENFTDTYNNLTLKSLLMLKLFNTYCDLSAKFLLKADDDTLVNLFNMARLLSTKKAANVLMGRAMGRYKPIRNTDNKWYMPLYLYPDELYPRYLGGSAYLMSGDVAKKLYETALQTAMLHIEDVYFTGVCAQKANIEVEHNEFFFCELKASSDIQYNCLKNFLVVTDISAANISRLYFVLSEMKWWSLME